MSEFKIETGRLQKRRRQRQSRTLQFYTPEKILNKKSKYNMIPKICNKMGYGYYIQGQFRTYLSYQNYNSRLPHTQQIKWQKQDFMHKINKLLGKHEITKKMTGKDKREIKQQLNGGVEYNKIIKHWKVVDRIVQHNYYQQFWNKLLSYTDIKTNNKTK